MGKASNYSNMGMALKLGNKIYPDELAGIIGLPSVGQIFYVDPGVTASGNGKSVDSAYKTLAEAHSAMSADNDDVVIIAPTSSTGRTSEAASITWAKRRTHIIGNGPARQGWNRQGVSFASTCTTPSLTISATNCSFSNIIFYQPNDINVMINITAAYTTFNNCHFAGIANETTGDDTAARCVVITDVDDTQFNNCMFGIDTVLNSAANAIVEQVGNTSCARTQYNNCIWSVCCDNAGPRFVLFTGAYSSEVYTRFRDCLFLNTRGGTSTMTVGMTIPASTNGTIVLDGCGVKGVTDWADLYTSLYAYNQPDVATSNSGFLEIVAT